MKFVTVLFALGLTVPVACQSNKTILEIVADSRNHITLEVAVGLASPKIGDALGNANESFTLFAPDDAAFMELGNATLGRLVSEPWRPHLDCVLQGHVSEGALDSSSISDTPTTVGSLTEGYALELVQINGAATVNGKVIMEPDLQATNGYVHTISRVLVPDCFGKTLIPQLTAAGRFSEIIALLDGDDFLSGFASSVLPDGATVFAPNDAAFDKLAPMDVEFLKNNTSVLRQVLSFHVMLGNFVPTETVSRSTIFTEEDEQLAVSVDGETVMVGPAAVLSTILAQNGIIHEIDSVLIPQSVKRLLPVASQDIAPTPAPTLEFLSGGMSTAASALIAMALSFALLL